MNKIAFLALLALASANVYAQNDTAGHVNDFKNGFMYVVVWAIRCRMRAQRPT